MKIDEALQHQREIDAGCYSDDIVDFIDNNYDTLIERFIDTRKNEFEEFCMKEHADWLICKQEDEDRDREEV